MQSLCKDDEFGQKKPKNPENIISLQNAVAHAKSHPQLLVHDTAIVMLRKRNTVTNPGILTLFSTSTEDTAVPCEGT